MQSEAALKTRVRMRNIVRGKLIRCKSNRLPKQFGGCKVAYNAPNKSWRGVVCSRNLLRPASFDTSAPQCRRIQRDTYRGLARV